MIALDRLGHVGLEVSLELVREPERSVRPRAPRRERQRALVPLDGRVEVVHLAVGVRDVHHRRFPLVRQRVRNQSDGVQEVLDGFRVVLVAVRQHAQLVVHERVRGADPAALLEELLRQTQVVRAPVLHADAQHGQVAPREQPRGGAVGGHGLVGLVLRGEGVPEPDPRGHERAVQRGRLGEEPPRRVEAPDAVVVAPHGEPRDGARRVLLH